MCEILNHAHKTEAVLYPFLAMMLATFGAGLWCRIRLRRTVSRMLLAKNIVDPILGRELVLALDR